MTDLLTHHERPADLDRLLWEISELRAQLERIQNFQLRLEEIDNLPETVHSYNYHVQESADPREDDPDLIYTRESIEALARLNDQLRRLLGECSNLDL